MRSYKKTRVEHRKNRTFEHCTYAQAEAVSFGRLLWTDFRNKKATAEAIAFFMVRETGLEPVRCEPHAPQTCASASSATPACRTRLRATLVLYTFLSTLSSLFWKKVSKKEKQKYRNPNTTFSVDHGKRFYDIFLQNFKKAIDKQSTLWYNTVRSVHGTLRMRSMLTWHRLGDLTPCKN